MSKRSLPVIILISSIISIFLSLFNLNYISLAISFFSLVLSIIFSKKKIRLLLSTIIISIATIITNILIIHNTRESIDIYEGINILLGTWSYNEIGGTYVFNNDHTYIHHINSNTKNNFCIGTYEYVYGGIGDDGIIIKEDDNFYYYNLDLKENYCIIEGKENHTKNTNKMILSIGKNNNKFLLINKETEELFILTKLK